MRRFVRQFSEREPAEHRERFANLLRWTEIERDGITSDPAQWPDWEAAVDATLADERFTPRQELRDDPHRRPVCVSDAWSRHYSLAKRSGSGSRSGCRAQARNRAASCASLGSSASG